MLFYVLGLIQVQKLSYYYAKKINRIVDLPLRRHR